MLLFISTEAGVSAESGLRTFRDPGRRDPGGLWEEHDPRTLATPEAFARDSSHLVTQTVDDFHQRAGSTVLAMQAATPTFDASVAGGCHLPIETPCPSCGVAGRLRPNFVWFGEMPHHLGTIGAVPAAADICVEIDRTRSETRP